MRTSQRHVGGAARRRDARPRAAPTAGTRRSRTTSNTSSSRVAAVTSGPAPGPMKHCGTADGIEQDSIRRAATRAPADARRRETPARRTRPDRPFDQAACASGFSVPPMRAPRLRSAASIAIDAAERRCRRRRRARARTDEEHRELFGGVPPVTSADGSGSARPRRCASRKRGVEAAPARGRRQDRVRRAVENRR